MKPQSCIKLLVLLTIFSTTVYSQTITDGLRLGFPGIGSSARALGMGNSYIGLSDDATAAYFNPAGFGLLKRMEFSGGLDYSNFSNDATLNSNGTLLGKSSNQTASSTSLNRVSFAFPFPTVQGSLVFGISYQRSKDFIGALNFNGYNRTSSFLQYLPSGLLYELGLNSAVKDSLGNITSYTASPINGNINQSGTVLNSGDLNNWTLSGAVEIYKNLFVGLNLNIVSGTYESNSDYFEDDVNNFYQGLTDPADPNTLDFKTFSLNRLTHWDLTGWDAKFGFLYQFNRHSRFGLTVQFPKTFTVKETFTVNGTGEFLNNIYTLNPDNFSDKVQYDIVTPFEIGAGFSFNIRGLILSAQGTLIDYSQLKFQNPDGIGADYIAGLNKDIQSNLTAVVNYNLGAEYTIPRAGVRLRAGYFVQPSAFKGDPATFDKKYFTAGLGFLADETIGLDLAYAHGWYHDFGDNYSSNLSRTEQDIKENHFILSGTYRF